MNHDYAHCLDYEKGKCPKKCFRAILTKGLHGNKIDYPVAWTHFKGTQYCKMDEVKERCCCNCRHNIRKSEKTYVSCRCDIDNHYIGYVETFEGWCKRWAKDRKFDEVKDDPSHPFAESVMMGMDGGEND